MRYVRQKLIQLVIVVIAVTFLTFISINLLPGDPAIFKAGPGATDVEVEQVRHDLGLDKPIPVQYRHLAEEDGDARLRRVARLQHAGGATSCATACQSRSVVLFYSLILVAHHRNPLRGCSARIQAGSTFDRTRVAPRVRVVIRASATSSALVLLYFFAVKWGWFLAISKDVSLFQGPR